jgi:hypothetical protein
VDAVFRSGEELVWIAADGSPTGSAPSRLMVQYLTTLFENAGDILRPFDNQQVTAGLNCLLQDEIYALEDTSVLHGAPWPERQRGLSAMLPLFAQCFAVRCSPHLSHCEFQAADPLNGVCYMWWDIYPAHGLARHHTDLPEAAEEDRLLLDVMDKILRLDADACRESALHGLNHWHGYYPDCVESTIDMFLAANPHLRPQLLQYALGARAGVLQ